MKSVRAADTVVSSQPRGYWTVDHSSNIRKFFDEFAISQSRDPKVPESWYDVSAKDIAEAKVCIWFLSLWCWDIRFSLFYSFFLLGLWYFIALQWVVH